MLTLTRFHLQLTRVTREDIELVREGRNSEHVRRQHLYQEPITPEEQVRWFERIHNQWNYFFMIRSGGRPVGVVYVKDFTPGMATSTCGVFVWDRDALGTRIPLLAILTVLDFFFGELRGGSTESVVLRSNAAAIKMNTFFGFAVLPADDPEQVRIHMDLERYLANRSRLLHFAYRAIKDEAARQLVLGGAPSPLNFDVINARLVSPAAHAVLSQGRGAEALPATLPVFGLEGC